MLQLCDNSICKTLELIFKQSMEGGSFTFEWKKGNIAPVHGKDDNIKKITALYLYYQSVERFLEN